MASSEHSTIHAETDTRWDMLIFLAAVGATVLYLFMTGEPPKRAHVSADLAIDQAVFEIYREDAAKVRRALDRVVDVNFPDDDGRTLLSHAACAGRADSATVVRMLLDRGANANARDSLNETPLFAATRFANTDVVATLLQAGSDPNARGIYAATPLHLAVDSSDAMNLTRMLLDAGGDPLAANSDGETPVDYARESGNGRVQSMLKEAIDKRVAVR